METKKNSMAKVYHILGLFRRLDWCNYDEIDAKDKETPKVIQFTYESGSKQQIYLTENEYIMWRGIKPSMRDIKIGEQL